MQCGATKTPCWRKGADGVRSLCNACGLKYSAELRRRNNRHDSRKRKKHKDDLDFGGDYDDFEEERKIKRRTLSSSASGFGTSRKRSSDTLFLAEERKPQLQRDGASAEEDDELSKETYIIDEEGDGVDLDHVQQKVRRLLATESNQRHYHFAFSCISKSQQTKLKRIVTKLGGTYIAHPSMEVLRKGR